MNVIPPALAFIQSEQVLKHHNKSQTLFSNVIIGNCKCNLHFVSEGFTIVSLGICLLIFGQHCWHPNTPGHVEVEHLNINSVSGSKNAFSFVNSLMQRAWVGLSIAAFVGWLFVSLKI